MMGSEWSFSSSEASCRWTVLPNNTWDDLGVHCTQPEPVGCDAPADWDVIVTGSNHTIVIPSSAIVSLADGNVLDHANVGVFYTNSEGNLACAGSAEITPGETVQIACYGR